MKYAVMIIDLRNSKKMDLDRRNEIQKQMLKIIKNLNCIFNSSIVKKVEFSAGDEIQGLFHDLSSAVMYYFLFRSLTRKIDIRCGIGYGEVTVFLENENTSAQDGPAYYLAREAINLTDQNNMDVFIHSKNENDLFINEYLAILKTLENELKTKQALLYQIISLLYPIDFIYQSWNKENYLEIITDFFYELIIENEIKKKSLINAHVTYFRNIKGLEDEKREKTIFFNEKKLFKGASIYLSSLLNTSRQNIEQIIRAGKLLELNSIKYVLLQFIKKNY